MHSTITARFRSSHCFGRCGIVEGSPLGPRMLCTLSARRLTFKPSTTPCWPSARRSRADHVHELQVPAPDHLRVHERCPDDAGPREGHSGKLSVRVSEPVRTPRLPSFDCPGPLRGMVRTPRRSDSGLGAAHGGCELRLRARDLRVPEHPPGARLPEGAAAGRSSAALLGYRTLALRSVGTRLP